MFVDEMRLAKFRTTFAVRGHYGHARSDFNKTAPRAI